MDPWKLAELNDARAWRNFELLQASQGHMMNAMFALEAGETKASAIDILKRGLAIIDAAHAETKARLAQGIEAGTGETREAGLDAKHESPVGSEADDAPNPLSNPNNQMAGGRVK